MRLAALNEILPRELQRRFDRLRSAADEERMAKTIRRVRDKVVGKPFCRLRGEEAGMGIFEPVELRAHGRDDVGMRMAETRHRGAAGGVDIFLARGVADEDAFRALRDRIGMVDLPVQDVGHDRLVRFLVVRAGFFVVRT